MMILLCVLLIYDDHDWGDNYDASFDLENLFEPHGEHIIDNNACNTIKSGSGRVSTLGRTVISISQ